MRSSLSAVEVGRRLDYPASSTAALLKSMVALGYLTYDKATRTYFPTIRLPLIANWIDQAILGDAKLDQLVEELRAETGETIIVAAQNGLEVQYLLNRPGIFPVRFLAPAGTMRPICGSGAGWALLSTKSDTDILTIVKQLNRSAPSGQRIDPVPLLDLLAQVRAQGYAASYGTVVAGSGIIAMVLPSLSRNRALVLGVGGPVERLEKKEATIVRKMRRAIRRHFPSHTRR
jgi:DNA-binding IclR family transcriptional regulator